MMKKTVINQQGFCPQFKSDGWLVASNAYKLGLNDYKSLSTMGRHLVSDEVFVLLNGEAIMLTAGFENEIGKLEAELLKPGIVYTVEKNQWHAILFNEEGLVLIVEDSVMEAKDNMTQELSPEQKIKGDTLVADILKK